MPEPDLSQTTTQRSVLFGFTTTVSSRGVSPAFS